MSQLSRRLGRRATALTAGAAVLALALAACSGGNAAKSPTATAGPQEVTFLTHWGPEQVTQLEAAAAAFKKLEPNITVKVQAVPFANLLSTLRTQGASANGPTIASIYSLWLPELVRDSIAAKAPADIATNLKANWPQNLVDAVSSNGTAYGIPNEVDLYELNYNTKLFAAAGISSPPATFSELVADAKKLTNKAQGRQGFGVITNWDSGVVHPFLSLVASNGGSMLDAGGTKADLTSPQAIAVADLYAQLVKDGSTVPTMSAANANTTGPYLDNFTNGKTGMIIMANWWQSALKTAMGDAYKDVATAPIPVGPSGTKSSSISYNWLTMVNGNADTAKQKAAWQFLTFLNGPESGKNGSSAMADVLMGMGILPSRTSDLKAHTSELSDPFLKAYVDGLPDATPFPSVIGGAAATQALQTNIEALVFGKATPAEAMASANTNVDSAIAAGK